jgi:hypothetical protein
MGLCRRTARPDAPVSSPSPARGSRSSVRALERPRSIGGHLRRLTNGPDQALGVCFLVVTNESRTRCINAPPRRRPVWPAQFATAQGGHDPGAHVHFRGRFAREEHSHPHRVSRALSIRVMRCQRAGRLMLPVSAQPDRDGSPQRSDIAASLECHLGVVSKGLSHPSSVLLRGLPGSTAGTSGASSPLRPANEAIAQGRARHCCGQHPVPACGRVNVAATGGQGDEQSGGARVTAGEG